ncbi:Aste57867_18553 [Aphanomyces stellatus]|uniref:Aste57867_18553 protein n=1 Tax=Aphanomyces stellatus TaxID=120398 RepID=A0A485LC19_9STRA|nr:hypothetical protein As57867_018491 [Aphanomyces stellatus]VFT95289.1 Aste57867_18553 [Aphanomyces stellatus]
MVGRSVLLSPDVLATIASFQDGLYHDMHPFLIDAAPRTRGLYTPTTRPDETFDRIMADSFHPRMCAWLEDHGFDRLPLLFRCLPFLAHPVLDYAAWSGNIALLDWFITAVQLGINSARCHSLFAIAAERNHVDVLEFLRGRGFMTCFELTKLGFHAWKTFLGAIQPGHLPTVRCLVEQFKLVATRKSQIDQLLQVAIPCHDIVQYLLGFVKLSKDQKKQALVLAAKAGQYDLALELLNRGFDTSALSIDMAAEGGNLHLVQLLDDLGGFHCTTWAMDLAARGGHFDVVRWLHAHRREGCTDKAFVSAVECGQVEMLQFLHVHYPGQVNRAALDSAMCDAAGLGHLATVQYLCQQLQCEASSLALQHAARCCHVEVVAWLCNQGATVGADPELMASAMDNALTAAIHRGDLAMLQWLDDNVSAIQWTASVPDVAIRCGHIHVVQWLMAHAKVAGVNSTAVHEAIEHDEMHELQCPQDYMATLNFELDDAMTEAATSGHVKMIRWLLQSNTHVCVCDVRRRVMQHDAPENLMRHILRRKASHCEKHM